ncbi:MAG TPA: hypothetical protein VEW48_11055 [Thermoanaerobaculia bacterium]|nr:hypothetical protein [Thermoanaerobaculia bacterium]
MSFLDQSHPVLRTPGSHEPNFAYFVARHDTEGQIWVERFSLPQHIAITATTTRALKLLRNRQMADGLRELDAAAEALCDVKRSDPDIFHTLQRWYFGALAYYYYCREEFSEAEQCLDAAHHEVREAIELRPFLLPLAPHCYDFWIQRVRIVRNQRRWNEMWHLVDIARQVFTGERPFCRLDDGTAIDFSALKTYYESMAPFSEEEAKPLRSVFDPVTRRRLMNLDLAEAFAMPGFVIPYRPLAPAT